MEESKLRKYKTVMCQRMIRNGTCRYGLLCDFAHDDTELRRNLNQQWYHGVKCEKNGCDDKECRFAHNDMEIMYHPNIYKSKLCQNNNKAGGCAKKNYCSFAHGRHELRPPKFNGEGEAGFPGGPGGSGDASGPSLSQPSGMKMDQQNRPAQNGGVNFMGGLPAQSVLSSFFIAPSAYHMQHGGNAFNDMSASFLSDMSSSHIPIIVPGLDGDSRDSILSTSVNLNGELENKQNGDPSFAALTLAGLDISNMNGNNGNFSNINNGTNGKSTINSSNGGNSNVSGSVGNKSSSGDSEAAFTTSLPTAEVSEKGSVDMSIQNSIETLKNNSGNIAGDNSSNINSNNHNNNNGSNGNNSNSGSNGSDNNSRNNNHNNNNNNSHNNHGNSNNNNQDTAVFGFTNASSQPIVMPVSLSANEFRDATDQLKIRILDIIDQVSTMHYERAVTIADQERLQMQQQTPSVKFTAMLQESYSALQKQQLENFNLNVKYEQLKKYAIDAQQNLLQMQSSMNLMKMQLQLYQGRQLHQLSLPALEAMEQEQQQLLKKIAAEKERHARERSQPSDSDIREVIICPVCASEPANRVLNCGHQTVCSSCIKRVQNCDACTKENEASEHSDVAEIDTSSSGGNDGGRMRGADSSTDGANVNSADTNEEH